MKKEKSDIVNEIKRLEDLKDFFKVGHKVAVNTENYLEGLSTFQKIVIGYDKLNKSNERIRDNYRRATSVTEISGGTNESLDRGNAKANKDFQAVWGEGSGEGFY